MGVERMYPPQYWRMRAEEFRSKADNYEHRQTKEALREAAKNYDELAHQQPHVGPGFVRFEPSASSAGFSMAGALVSPYAAGATTSNQPLNSADFCFAIARVQPTCC
jgi:hypothetical protein